MHSLAASLVRWRFPLCGVSAVATVMVFAGVAAMPSRSAPDVRSLAATGQFDAVSCAGPSFCLAVGSVVAVWNGSAWHLVSPPAAGSLVLNGVSCPAAHNCAVVGQVGTKLSTRTLAERWTGSGWTPMALGGRTAVDLQVISCPTTEWCMVGGSSGSGATTRAFSGVWNGPAGSTFAVRPSPSPADATFTQIRRLSCASASVCVALDTYLPKGGSGAGVGVLPTRPESWNGQKWTAVPTTYALDDVSCLAGDSLATCTFLGVYGSLGSSYSDTLVMAPSGWAGVGDIRGSAKLTGAPDAYSCASADSCQAVGQRTLRQSGDVLTYAEHWNGNHWSNVASASPNSPDKGSGYDAFFAVSCVAPDDCQAVGRANRNLLAERWNGQRWRDEAIAG